MRSRQKATLMVLMTRINVCIREFGVNPKFQGQGIGQKLMAKVVEDTLSSAFRCIVCETQNTNFPAIQFYRKMGFTFDGIDTGLYSNQDFERGEVAIFMRKAVSAI